MTVLTFEETKIEEALKSKNIAPDSIVFQVDVASILSMFCTGIERIIDRFPQGMSKELLEKFAKTYMEKWLTNGDGEGLRYLSALCFQEVYGGTFRSEIKELFAPDEISYITMFC
jgi:hypothetical protein